MMRTRISLFFFCICVFAFSGYGQVNPDYSDSDSTGVTKNVTKSSPKSVTNANLEKFRRNRVRAQKELRENYEQLGFPSPKEIARQDEKSRAEMAELSARFEAERLERERIAAQLAAAEAQRQDSLRKDEAEPDYAPRYRERYYDWRWRKRNPYWQPW